MVDTNIHNNDSQSRDTGGGKIMLLSPRVSKTEWQFNEQERIPKTVMSTDQKRQKDGGTGSVKIWTRMWRQSDGGDGEASSTVLRSCRAGRNREGHLLQTAWCRSHHSSGCTLRWGRNECLRSNSSTSRRDSESGAQESKQRERIELCEWCTTTVLQHLCQAYSNSPPPPKKKKKKKE